MPYLSQLPLGDSQRDKVLLNLNSDCEFKKKMHSSEIKFRNSFFGGVGRLDLVAVRP